jgi:N-acetylneuraminic acid mutarotase
LFSLRPLFALLCCAAAICSVVVTGTLLAFWCSGAAAKASQRTLTFAERVAYQRAIEEVYWRHRIWPKESPDPKPSFDGVMSQAQLEKKVTDYLRKSQTLEDYWKRPITAEQLQTEMNRMGQHTKLSEMLRELFDALGNDPFVIAESLARPVLARRLLRNLLRDQEPLDSSRTGAEDEVPEVIAVPSAKYVLPEILDPNGCTDDTWTDTSTANAPSGRINHTAVWTGSEMIVWGGEAGFGNYLNTGGRYDPSTDSWAATSTTNAPSPRSSHTAIWTGNEMIIWGGNPGTGYLNTGGKYDPSTDSWIATSTTNAPTARLSHTAVWTGSEMIVWGGDGNNATILNTGGRYNPDADSWTVTSTTNAPSARVLHTAVWTGNEMIVWGGVDANFLNTGGRYHPITDSWIPTSTAGAPSGRYNYTAVWTGSEMIIWGGTDNFNRLNTGGRYNPITDSWAATSTSSAPSGRQLHTAVWTGSEMIVWGGLLNARTDLNTSDRDFTPSDTPHPTPTSTPTATPTATPEIGGGGKYDPATDGWTATSTTNAPGARFSAIAIWADQEMIVWGGAHDQPSYEFLNTGGRYCAVPAPTPTPTPTPTATATPIPTATPSRLTPIPRPRPTPAPRR